MQIMQWPGWGRLHQPQTTSAVAAADVMMAMSHSCIDPAAMMTSNAMNESVRIAVIAPSIRRRTPEGEAVQRMRRGDLV